MRSHYFSGAASVLTLVLVLLSTTSAAPYVPPLAEPDTPEVGRVPEAILKLGSNPMVPASQVRELCRTQVFYGGAKVGESVPLKVDSLVIMTNASNLSAVKQQIDALTVSLGYQNPKEVHRNRLGQYLVMQFFSQVPENGNASWLFEIIQALVQQDYVRMVLPHCDPACVDIADEKLPPISPGRGSSAAGVFAKELGPRSSDPDRHWHMKTIKADKAFEKGFQGTGAAVAVLDTGISLDHKELEDRHHPFIGRNFLDADQSATVEDEPEGHGTFMAGLIASEAVWTDAPARAGIDGSVGVAPKAKVLTLKVASECCPITASRVAQAIDWAVSETDVRLFNLSYTLRRPKLEPLGLNLEPLELHVVLKNAGGRALFVNSAGGLCHLDGNPSDPMSCLHDYPAKWADLQNLLVVRQTNKNDVPQVSSWGNQSVDMAAPGTGLYGPLPGGFDAYSGSSNAAALTTGAAALIWGSKDPQCRALTPEQLRCTLMCNSRQPPTAAIQNTQSCGVLDVGFLANRRPCDEPPTSEGNGCNCESHCR